MKNNAMGLDTINEINIKARNSLKNSQLISETDEPRTLRMPISLNRRSTIKEANPNKPKHAIITAIEAKKIKIKFNLCSD